MAFGVFDATVGGEDANSYVTLEYADAYFTLTPYADTWAALTDAQKQAYLVRSLQTINNCYAWFFYPTTKTQALPFPASDVVDCAGKEYADDVIPAPLQIAQMEQAYYLTTIDATQTPTAIMQGLSSATVGSLSATFDSSMTVAKMNSQISNILRCFGKPITNVDGGNSYSNGQTVRA